MADDTLKTPANTSTDVAKVANLSVTKRKQLLNSYLKASSEEQKAKRRTSTKKASKSSKSKSTKLAKKAPTTITTNNSSDKGIDVALTPRSTATPAVNRINRPQVKQLGDLQDILDDHPKSLELAAGVKQLGSIESILQGKSQAMEAEVIPETVSPYESGDLFGKKDRILDTDAFTDTAATATSFNLGRNLPLFAATVFGIGACVFGINQLISNANYNFASEYTTSEQPAVTPPRILTFQGRLTDFDQNSITQPKQMRFVLYNTSGGNTPPPIGGEILWDSGFCTVSPNQSGIFTVNLGAGNGDGRDDYNCGQTLGNIFAQNSNVWLQITVDDEVLFPRQLIKSVPFALNSETLQGYSASQSATANTIPVVDSNGNMKFATENTSLVNLGNLGLISQTGDIYLIPGSGSVYVGSATQSANLLVNGTVAARNLDLSQGNSQLVYNSTTGLTLRSSTAKTIWNAVTIDKNGNLGLGTNSARQKLTINNGSIAFEFISGPDASKMTVSEDITDTNALRRIDAPTTSLQLATETRTDSTLGTGTYRYAYTFTTSDGSETALSPISAVNVTLDGQAVTIANLATSSHPSVTGRKLYRTTNGGTQFYLVKTITDNTSTTAADILPDSELTTPAANLGSTGTYRYKLTFVGENGESSPSDSTQPLTLSGDGRVVKISNIPLASSTEQIAARRLYRSLANSDDYYLIAELTDNTVSTVYDSLNDYELATRDPMPTAGSIYTNGHLSLQFGSDGTIKTNDTLIADGRIEASYGDNQGLKLPTSAGKPYAKVGQQVGDIVYDSVGQVLYIYNGVDFVPTGVTSTNSVSLANSSNCTGNLCRLVLDAEYAGAVITGDGSHNNGTFAAGNETIADNYRFNYYSWTSNDATTLNDFDTTISLTIPSNFTSWQSAGLTLDFATTSTDPDLNSVQLEVFRSGTAMGITKSNLVSSTAGTWMSAALGTQPATITGDELAALGFRAGDQLTIKVKTAAKQGQAVKIGQINVNYLTDNGIIDTGTQSLWKQVAGAIFPATNSDIILGGDSTASASIGFFNLAGQGTPTLFVRGNLFLDSKDKSNSLDLAEGSAFNIRSLDADGNATTHFTILPNGNIGVGTATPTEKLEVNGNVKVDGSLQLAPIEATEVGACTADVEGKIYYNATDKAFYACQADLNTGLYSWQPLN